MAQPLRHCRRPQYNYNSMFFVTMSAQSMFVLVGEARPHLHAGNHGVCRALIANGRLVMMLITDRLFQNGASPCWHPWHTSAASACSDRQRQIVNEVDHRQILSEQRPAKIAEDRLARMRIIDMCFQRRMVRLVATMSYITRDVRAEIANGRLAMLEIIERFLRVNSGAKIAKDRLATMAIIRMFFQRRRVRLPATMGYITRDVRAEIANDRLATMDVIGIKFCDSWYGRSRTDSGIQPGSHVDGDGRVASTHEDAEARSHLHAGHGLHDAREIMRIFRCRRTVELKHGGISMQTSAKVVAYCGFCEPSAQAIAYCGFCELSAKAVAYCGFCELSAKVVAYCGFCELSTGRDRSSWIKLYK